MKNKLKTRKSVLKRIRITGSGKILINRMSSQHLALKKSKRARKHAKQRMVLSGSDYKMVKRAVNL